MAVSFRGVSNGVALLSTNASFAHNFTGTPNGVILFVLDTYSSSSTVTGATYGGVSLNAVTSATATDASGEPCRTSVWFKGTGLPSGNQTVNVSTTDFPFYAYLASVTADRDTEIYLPGIVLLQGDGTVSEQNVDDGSPGSNSLRFAAGVSGRNSILTVGSNSTSLGSGTSNSMSYQVVRETTAGQGSRPVGFTYSTSDDRAFSHVAVREIPQTRRIYNIN